MRSPCRALRIHVWFRSREYWKCHVRASLVRDTRKREACASSNSDQNVSNAGPKAELHTSSQSTSPSGLRREKASIAPNGKDNAEHNHGGNRTGLPDFRYASRTLL